jgi:hypothetical protein
MTKYLTLSILACAMLVQADQWSSYGGDPQRTGWARTEKLLTKDSVKGLKLEWSLKLDNPMTELYGLTAPVVTFKTITPKGFKEYVIMAGSGDTMFAVDADTGKLVWNKKFDEQSKPTRKQAHWLCPNALIATPYFDRCKGTVHVISIDGRLHSLNVVNGEDRTPPIQFIPPYAKPWSLNMFNGVLYTALAQGCAARGNGVYAIDLNDPNRPISHFQTAGGIWGRAGVAIGENGRVYAEIGDGQFDPDNGKWSDAVVALEPKTLKLADWYIPTNQLRIDNKDLDMGNISPVVFPWKDAELIAASGKEGVIYLLDSKSLGGADHHTPAFRSPLYTNEDVHFAGRGFWGAMATWESNGARWLYAPAYGPRHPKSPAFPTANGDAPDGSIMAFKVVEKEGKPALDPVWMSTNMIAPDPPVIANGVVFALSTGDDTTQVNSSGGIVNSAYRAAHAKPAKLFAFDAETGKVLFSSGDQIKSFVHFSGLSIAEGKIYVVTADSTLYAFGLGM